MKVRVVAVGRVRDAALAQAVTGYESRAARYWPLEVIEVREGTGKDPAVVKKQEGERLLERAGTGTLVACDERGEALTSVAFAEWLQRLRDEARDVAFLLGGAHGLDAAVLARAQRSPYPGALHPAARPGPPGPGRAAVPGRDDR